MTRQVEGFETVNPYIRRPVTIDPEASPVSTNGSVPTELGGAVSAQELGDGVIHQTVLTVSGLQQSILDATSWKGTKIYGFPAGRLHVLGVVATLAPTTKTAIATTIKSGVAGHLGLGTTAASKIAIDTTMVDLLPDTATVNSTTINVPAAAVNAALAAAAVFDGTSAAKDVYLNASVAAADIDGNGVLEWNGVIRLTWINLGDY